MNTSYILYYIIYCTYVSIIYIIYNTYIHILHIYVLNNSVRNPVKSQGKRA